MTYTSAAVQTLIGKVVGTPDAKHANVFRQLFQAGLHDLIEAKAAAIGATKCECTEENPTSRNGIAPRS